MLWHSVDMVYQHPMRTGMQTPLCWCQLSPGGWLTFQKPVVSSCSDIGLSGLRARKCAKFKRFPCLNESLWSIYFYSCSDSIYVFGFNAGILWAFSPFSTSSPSLSDLSSVYHSRVIPNATVPGNQWSYYRFYRRLAKRTCGPPITAVVKVSAVDGGVRRQTRSHQLNIKIKFNFIIAGMNHKIVQCIKSWE